ncbi:MAG: class I SAM-dependent methyltransferase [Kaiparowitsia implicata GSE-PSE-MK54-09C]|jgi:SAM-dependent methyltransferase|nr:class I SAM-dependent methyltransferase [Kaiparowitsia implicata GSE-PSE-MK54-09C]
MEEKDKPAGAMLRLEAPPYDTVLDAYSVKDLVGALVQRTADAPSEFEAVMHWSCLLAIELDQVSQFHSNHFSQQRLFDIFRMLFSTPEFRPEDVQGKIIVELGCGGLNPLSRLFMFLMLGAERVIGVDLDVVKDERYAAIALARTAAWMLTNPTTLLAEGAPAPDVVIQRLRGIDLAKLSRGDLSGLDGSALEFRRESVYEMSLAASSVDVVMSTSFLEHVPDAARAIACINHITKPDGLGIHAIDGVDHWHYFKPDIHPLDFLRIDSPDALVRECNRVRPLQFISMFEQAGCQIFNLNKTTELDLSPLQRQDLSAPFREMSDEMLAIARAQFFMRKVSEAPAHLLKPSLPSDVTEGDFSTAPASASSSAPVATAARPAVPPAARYQTVVRPTQTSQKTNAAQPVPPTSVVPTPEPSEAQTLQQLHQTTKQLRQKLQRVRKRLDRAEAEVAEMKASRFWQWRSVWLQFKQRLRR